MRCIPAGVGAAVPGALSPRVTSPPLGKRRSRIGELTALSSWRLHGGSLWHSQGSSPRLGLGWEARCWSLSCREARGEWRTGMCRNPGLTVIPRNYGCCRPFRSLLGKPSGAAVCEAEGGLCCGAGSFRFLWCRPWRDSLFTSLAYSWQLLSWSQTTYAHTSEFRFRVGVLFILHHDEFWACSGLR